MTVTVTARHMAQGQRKNHLRNPIALALQEADKYAVVTDTKIHMIGRVVELPFYAKEWLARFNRGWDVCPLTVTV